MEKDILIQGLKTRIGEDDAKIISDKTFDGVATEVLGLFADDSKVTDETWKLPVALLKQFAGQKRFDEKTFTEKFKAEYANEFKTQHEKDVETRINAAVAKALEDYKKEHPEGDGGKGGKDPKDIDVKVQEAVKNALAGLTGADSELGKSLATINQFVKTQQEREKTETLNRVKTQLQSYLTELETAARKGGSIPDEITALIEDTVKYLEYGENPTYDELKSTVKTAYEKEYKRRYPNGGKPFGGDSTGGQGGENGFVKKTIERLKKEAEDSANYATELEKGFV